VFNGYHNVNKKKTALISKTQNKEKVI